MKPSHDRRIFSPELDNSTLGIPPQFPVESGPVTWVIGSGGGSKSSCKDGVDSRSESSGIIKWVETYAPHILGTSQEGNTVRYYCINTTRMLITEYNISWNSRLNGWTEAKIVWDDLRTQL